METSMCLSSVNHAKHEYLEIKSGKYFNMEIFDSIPIESMKK